MSGVNKQQIARAMTIMVGAMLFAPMMDAIAKILSTQFDVSPATLTFGRFVVQFVFLFPFVALMWAQKVLPVSFSWINILRGMIMGLAAMLFFTAVKYMPLADAISIFFVEPLILMLFSGIFLGEVVGWRRRTAALVGFCGAMIVIRPSYELFGFISLLPLSTAILFSFYLILTRKVGGFDHPLVMQFYAGIGGAITCGLAIIIGTYFGMVDFSLALPTNSQGWAFILALGLFAVSSHLLIVFAFKLAPASILAPFQYIEIVGATILGLLIFGEFPDATKWLGISIIVGSGIYVFWREQRLEQEADLDVKAR